MKKFLTTLAVIGVLGVANATKTYDEALGLQAMYYSGAAYCDTTSVKNWACGEACSAQPTSEITNIEAYWAGTFAFTGYN